MIDAIPMTLREANEFVASYHRHSGRTPRDGGKFAIGATDGSGLVGVAIVGRPLSRILGADVYTAESYALVRSPIPRRVPTRSFTPLAGGHGERWVVANSSHIPCRLKPARPCGVRVGRS